MENQKKNIADSTIYSSIYKEFSLKNFGWSDAASKATIYSVFEGIAVFLGKMKNKDLPVAIKVCDIYGSFCIGGYVQFHKSEEEGTDEGSWTLNYTFDENDIEKNWKIYDMAEDMEAFESFANIAYTHYGMAFQFLPKDKSNSSCEGSPQDIVCTAFNVIKEYLRANVTIAPELEITGIVTITAEIGDSGSVVYGFEPDPEMKQYVKDDANIK